MHVAAVRDQLDAFGSDTDVALITFSDPDHLEPYLQRQGLAFPVLSDPDRTTYQAFGIGRGTVLRVWGWRMARRYVEIYREHGFQRPERATEDTLQLGGNFIINPEGTLIYGYWGEGPDDRPAIESLIAAIETDRRTNR